MSLYVSITKKVAPIQAVVMNKIAVTRKPARGVITAMLVRYLQPVQNRRRKHVEKQTEPLPSCLMG